METWLDPHKSSDQTQPHSIIVNYSALGGVSSRAIKNHNPGEYRERPHGSGTREEKRSPKNARVEFLKTPAYRVRVDGPSMMSYIIQYIPCKRCYIVLLLF